MIDFTNFTTLSRNTSTLPIFIDDVKSYSRYFQYGSLVDTSFDAHITKRIKDVIDNWESETRFLIYDQTIKASLYNQEIINQNFKARLGRLNIRSFGDILYHSRDWNEADAKAILSTDIYKITTEFGRTPAIFQLKGGVCYLELYPVYNNLEITFTGGYASNDFTNMPQIIKNALAMNTADVIDRDTENCKDYAHWRTTQEIWNYYSADHQIKYTAGGLIGVI